MEEKPCWRCPLAPPMRTAREKYRRHRAGSAAAFPERTLRRAFTSGMILRRLAGEGLAIDGVPAALERLAAEGYGDVLIQPTHVMNGEEYHKLMDQAAPYRPRFAHMAFGRPLLTAAEDYLDLGRALLDTLPPAREEAAVVYMGHGSDTRPTPPTPSGVPAPRPGQAGHCHRHGGGLPRL